ncbi:MAG TPA: OmpH family outer membrane protein [Methylomirabilota bacterium]|jgi:outer membrane protein|nr:OmpH family outer membrane protein [Methylomirabilota bacterium]
MRAGAEVVLTALLVGLTVAGAEAQAPGPAPAPAPAAAAAASMATKIGYIDVQRVLARSAAGVAAREQLEKERAGIQKEMDGRRQELEKLRDEIEKKGPLLTADARREKQEQFDRKRRDAARAADDYQKELEKKEAALLQKVLQEMGGVIERVGKEKNYYMIVEKRNAGVLYAATDADLTDEVIRAYDREAGAKKK